MTRCAAHPKPRASGSSRRFSRTWERFPLRSKARRKHLECGFAFSKFHPNINFISTIVVVSSRELIALNFTTCGQQEQSRAVFEVQTTQSHSPLGAKRTILLCLLKMLIWRITTDSDTNAHQTAHSAEAAPNGTIRSTRQRFV